ncbi:amino acid ABC transporter ATP-binding protein [Rhodococcus sp. HM1]|uniref:amino acid ABC transporter ATP-binding protein n=1 Tax=unclassified Rhodococcus (in: high G+C Gram-positive bacteria) TaxID=192944 RepID=UPI00200B27CA|nr:MULTISPECIES: amino acid ABC transporter ATP-binding protein [unclassified Rhodococcus (in: high G+C Gram-positive bacteria)]MCK8672415.1 amino acid ABC transporter ATP-binding protein [Rhodococcus sp. HM1]
MDSSPGAVVLRGVGKKFTDDYAVTDVSLTVARGEVLAIIGPSGAGKSSLLRCINLLDAPTAGEIVVDGIQVRGADGTTVAGKELAELRRRVGMVFQSFNLFPHLSVLQNVSLAQTRVLGRSKAEANARSLDLLERVGLADKAAQHPTRLSGGQQQRVAIARALALDPSVMLFDEPTSALDPELGLEVLAVMRELADEGMTMLIVSHELHFAEEVSDRILVMADGRAIESGPPEQVLRNPTHARTQQFLGALHER